MAAIRPYRRGNLPAALVAAAREFLTKATLTMWGCVKRRAESAFRPRRPIAISPARKILFASVAAQGFRELRAAMKDAAAKGAGGPGALSRRGVAYIQFAAQNRGLFRVMFGEILVEREKYPVLDAAVSAVVSDFLVRDKHSAAVTAWGLIHGLAHLVIDGFIPASEARTMAEKMLNRTRPPRKIPRGRAGQAE